MNTNGNSLVDETVQTVAFGVVTRRRLAAVGRFRRGLFGRRHFHVKRPRKNGRSLDTTTVRFARERRAEDVCNGRAKISCARRQNATVRKTATRIRNAY